MPPCDRSTVSFCVISRADIELAASTTLCGVFAGCTTSLGEPTRGALGETFEYRSTSNWWPSVGPAVSCPPLRATPLAEELPWFAGEAMSREAGGAARDDIVPSYGITDALALESNAGCLVGSSELP